MNGTDMLRRLASGTALGIALLLTVADWVHHRAGTGAALDYLLAAVLLLPVIEAYLGLVRRADLPGLANPYALARTGLSSRRAFAVGWLLLGSAVGAAAALSIVASRIATPAVDRLFATSLNETLLAAVFSLIIVFDLQTGRVQRVAVRDRIAILGLIALGVFAAQLTRQATTPVTADPLTLTSPLRVAAVIAVGLWALVLVFRREPEGPAARHLLGRLIPFLTWLVPVAIMAASAVLWRRQAGEAGPSWLFDVVPADSRLDLLGRGAGAVLCLLAASQIARSLRSLATAMSVDRMLVGLPGPPGKLPLLLIPIALLAVPRLVLAGFASATMLWGIGILVWRGHRSPDTPESTASGLVRNLAAAIALLVPMLLPGEAFLASVLWSLGGSMLWWSWAGQRAQLAGTKLDDAELDDGRKQRRSQPVALLALPPTLKPAAIRSALRVAAGFGLAEGGSVLATRLLTGSDLGDEDAQTALDRAAAEIAKQVEACDLPSGARIVPSAQLAASLARGVHEALAEHPVSLVFLAAGSESSQAWIERVLIDSSTSTVVLPPLTGAPPERVVLAVGGGPSARTALPFATRLAGTLGASLELVSVDGPARSEKDVQQVLDQLAQQAENPPSTRIVRGAQTAETLAAEYEEALFVVGASIDPLIDRPSLGGVAADLRERSRTVVLVKGPEDDRRLWLRRLWSSLSSPFDPLTTSERADIAAAMRRSATANIGFYVLLLLAALIASVGLVLDSSATVIGAMLVAPLMSPILAFAHGLVLGSLPLMRRSLGSIARGSGGAIIIGVLVAVALPTRVATSQMLARGEPGLLDLLVAVASGAAAAYASCNSSLSGALPGVAISVALVPPLCVAGWALGSELLPLAAGAFLLFLTNLAGIVLSSALVFGLLGVRPSRQQHERRVRQALTWTVVFLLAVSIPLGFQSLSQMRDFRIGSLVDETLRERAAGERVEDLDIEREATGLEIDVTLSVEDGRGNEAVEAIRQRLETVLREPVRLRARLLSVRTIDTLDTD